MSRNIVRSHRVRACRADFITVLGLLSLRIVYDIESQNKLNKILIHSVLWWPIWEPRLVRTGLQNNMDRGYLIFHSAHGALNIKKAPSGGKSIPIIPAITSRPCYTLQYAALGRWFVCRSPRSATDETEYYGNILTVSGRLWIIRSSNRNIYVQWSRRG